LALVTAWLAFLTGSLFDLTVFVVIVIISLPNFLLLLGAARKNPDLYLLFLLFAASFDFNNFNEFMGFELGEILFKKLSRMQLFSIQNIYLKNAFAFM
jgi:hypothetical protein